MDKQSDVRLPVRQEEEQHALEKGAHNYLTMAKELVIENDEDMQFADEADRRGMENKKNVEKFFAPHVARTHAAWKGFTDDRKRLLDPIVQGIRLIGGKMAGYRAEVRRKDAEKAAEAAKEAAKKADKQKAAEVDKRLTEAVQLDKQGKGDLAEKLLKAPLESDNIQVAPAPPTAVPKTMRKFRTSWFYEIIDPDLVPMQYRPIDEKLVRGAVKLHKGSTNIPGVRVYSKEIPC